MIDASSKNVRRRTRQQRARRRLQGTSARPRLCVFRSLNHIYAQVIDDQAGTTLATASSLAQKSAAGKGGNLAAAKAVGEAIATGARAKGVQAVVFDRGGYPYHGRVKALAEAARAAGLQF